MATWAMSQVKSLRVSDYFERRWSSLLGRPVLAPIRLSSRGCPIGRVGWFGTIGSLWIVHGALKRVREFSVLEPDEYDYAVAEGCHRCEETVLSAEQAGLGRVMNFYWYAAHATVGIFLVFDACRLFGVSSLINDALLGYHSARAERRRKLAFLALAIPFAHLCLLYSRPVTFGCCVATPKWEPLQARVNQLAFLLFVTGFILLGKAQDHGYFLLRIPPQDSCALYLVRDYLMNKEDERHGGKAKARTASLILMALGQGGGRPSDERARLNDSDEAEFDPA